MKKKLFILFLCFIAGTSMLEARRWGHRHHGYHRGWGGFPVGFGFTVPIGGGTKRRSLPDAVKQFNRDKGYDSDYEPGQLAFCQWAQDYFKAAKAENVCDQYQNYLKRSRTRYSEPPGAFSFGFGAPYDYGYRGPYGVLPYHRGWW